MIVAAGITDRSGGLVSGIARRRAGDLAMKSKSTAWLKIDRMLTKV